MNTKTTLLAGLVLSSSFLVPISALAQVRHHRAKAVVAGIAAYEVAKHTGSRGHKNFFQRHPVLTGIGTAMAVNHHLKKKHRF